jgi:hypothetical protein
VGGSILDSAKKTNIFSLTNREIKNKKFHSFQRNFDLGKLPRKVQQKCKFKSKVLGEKKEVDTKSRKRLENSTITGY